MMKIFPVLVVLGLSGCVTFAPTQLSKDNYLNLEGEGTDYAVMGSMPLEEYNGGVIADFEKGNIGNWWGSSKILLTKRDGNLIVNASGVGKEYDRFGYTFSPTVDFTKMNILKVRVKADGNMIPTLRIDLKDKNGFVTNSQDAKSRLILCEEYVEYYYRYEGRFRQGWPFRADVDPANISELEIFINPGGQNFSGTITIDEIKQISEEDMWKEIEASESPCDVTPNNDFSEGSKYCWANSDLYTLSAGEEGELKVQVRGAGSGWQSFGVGFSKLDLGERPVLRVRAKVKGESAAQLRVDLLDFSGNATNGQAIEYTVPNDNTYRDYFFDYQDKLYQGWPTAEKVDSRFINELMLFANPGGPDFTGEIYIDEIEVVKNYTSEDKEGLRHYFGDDKASLELFASTDEDNTWWVAKSGVEIESNGKFKIEGNTTAMFGTGVDVFNAYEHGKLVTALTSEGIDVNASVKMKLIDNRGETTPLMAAKVSESTAGAKQLEFDLKSVLSSNKEFNGKIVTGVIFQVTTQESGVLEIKNLLVKI